MTTPPPADGSGGGGNRTLLYIVGGAVALAAIGIVLWLVLGGKDAGKGASPVPTGGGTLSPSPVPTTAGPTTTPTSTPTTPPTETTPPPPPPGDGVVIGGHTTVPRPEGWEVFGSNEDAVEMGDSSGDYFFAKIEHGVDPSSDAGAIVQNVAGTWFNESYSQVQMSDPQSFPPFGGIVSVSRLDYEGIFTSQAGANEVRGFILVAVRQDGELLVSVVESTPPDAFETNEPIWSPVATGTLASFAGA